MGTTRSKRQGNAGFEKRMPIEVLGIPGNNEVGYLTYFLLKVVVQLPSGRHDALADLTHSSALEVSMTY